jgi:hypothetical protein
LAELDRALSAVVAGPETNALSAVERALALYRGDLFADVTFEWGFTEREHLRRRVIDAGHALLETTTHPPGDERRVLDVAARLLVIDPLDERAHAAAIVTRGRLGDRAGAKAQFERCRDVLAAELGVQPSAHVRAAYAEAMSEPPAPAAPPPRSLGDAATAPAGFENARASGDLTIRPGVGPAARTERTRLTWQSFGVAAVAVAVSIALAGVGAAARSARQAGEATTAELVNEHRVAAYMEQLAVITDTSGAVDDWFRERVPFPVVAYAGIPGVELYGAGLCDVSGQIAATAVYRADNGERISVFSFPQGRLPLPVAEPVGQHGYRGVRSGHHSVVFRVHNGLVQVFVSGMAVDELADTAARLHGRAG